MHSDTIASLSARWQPRVRFPFKPLALISLALIAVAVWVVMQAKEQEQARLYSDLRSRADVLIWALEGSERSMMMRRSPGSPVPQAVIEEVAKQPAIAFVAVLDANGGAVAHSLPGQRGTVPPVFGEFGKEAMTAASQGRLVEIGDEKLYEVIKAFTPFVTHEDDGMGLGRIMQPDARSDFSKDGFYIVVAMDAVPFLSKMPKHVWHYIMIAFLLVMAAIGGVTLLFYMHSLSASKRMLLDTQVLASQLFAKLPIGVFTTNAEGLVTLYNESAAALLGFREDAGAELSVREHPWFDWKGLAPALAQGETVLEHEAEFMADDGKCTAVSIAASPVTRSDGHLSGYIFIVRDLVEVKKLQKQLRLNERLTALGDLAAGVAHELRNPLSSVKGYATFLSMKLKDNAPLREKAQMMLTEVERLSRVVSDLLSMANPGKARLRPEPLLPIVERVMRLTEPEAVGKGVALVFAPPQADDGEYSAMLDADKIIQALLNLTINAVQATERGGTVRVTLLCAPDDGQGQAESVVVSVADTGGGIQPDALANIFTPYFSTKPSGTGLGLAIAHRIIEQHGGEITVSSKPGEGSVFSVRLPLRGRRQRNCHEQKEKTLDTPCG